MALYNHQLPQSAIKSKTPMQTMKEWYQTHPHLFYKPPYTAIGMRSAQPDLPRVAIAVDSFAHQLMRWPTSNCGFGCVASV